MIVADFASEYGIRISAVSMPWPEFHCLTDGLFEIDSRIRRHFFPPNDPETEG